LGARDSGKRVLVAGGAGFLGFAELIFDPTGSRSKITHRAPPEDDPPRRRPDISEAGRVLNWRPMVGLREGLESTIAYFSKSLSTSCQGAAAVAAYLAPILAT
jgi:UDP-glucuronate decarboxylase